MRFSTEETLRRLQALAAQAQAEGRTIEVDELLEAIGYTREELLDYEELQHLREESERLQAFVLLAEARDWISKDDRDQLLGLRPPSPAAALSALAHISQDLGLYVDTVESSCEVE
jgi:hypothetical protein